MHIYTYPGNIHIHSSYSDGSGTVPEIAAAAASAGMRYIIITDHNTLAALREEGYQQGIVVLAGIELNNQCCHYLALNVAGKPSCCDHEPQKVISAVAAKGGLGFIAHPFEKGSSLIDGGKAYPWTSWPVFGFTGIEIWNYSSHWRGRATSAAKAIYWFLFNRRAAMDGPPAECLKLWDCYTSAGHPVVAIGGTDAHAFRRKVAFLPVTIFPYHYLCRTINTYICLREPLSINFDRAKKQVYSALKDGRCYVSLDQIHSGEGFTFTACRPQAPDDEVLMGETLCFNEEWVLRSRAPSSCSIIRLFRNGSLIEQRKAPAMSFKPTMPGTYRIEVYYRPLLGRPRPWLYSNPIYLLSIK